MSPLLDLQQRSRELGRIRVGAQVAHGKGSRPVKLDAFRFTTNSPMIARAVAEMFGGRAQPWDSGTQSHEVFTEATEFDVMVPPGDAALSQWYELWSGGGCQRRCDGVTETLKGGPCLCPADIPERMDLAASGGACKPTTRVNVILPDLPDIGVFRYESHGYYAAVELGGTAELLARAREAGVIVPATMRLEQREVKRNGQTRRFPVVVLEIKHTLRELVGVSGEQTLADALPPAPTGAKAIEGPKPPAVSREVTAGPSTPDGVARGKPAPSGDPLPDDPQAIADLARTADLGLLARLAEQAKTLRVARELIADETGVMEPLWDFLLARKADLEGGQP